MSLTEDLMRQLSGAPSREIGERLGLDSRQASAAIAAALPMLLGGLAKNASTQEGGTSLAGALERDHDGGVLDDLAGFFGQGGNPQDGAGILGHVFGARRNRVEDAIGRTAGVDGSTASQLLAMLAPVVMGFLARQRGARDPDASDLTEMFSRERETAPGEVSGAMDAIGRMLDADDDGEVMDDLAGLGASLMGKLLGGR